ncbi:MAG: hypothetical protein IKK97_05795 [Phascolarctobacterium sp.]|nr:hypothetical protein [Phascolarctobacterium sp.]
MKIKSIAKILPTLIFSLLCASSVFAFKKPVLLAEQGSFFAGGNVLQSEGTFDYNNPMNTAGQTLWCRNCFSRFSEAYKNSHHYLLW